MNIQSAAETLEININHLSSFTSDTIKKQYYKLALLHHPDKHSNSEESTKRFQSINTAYQYLKKEMQYFDKIGINMSDKFPPSNDPTTQAQDDSKEVPAYVNLLGIFINTLVKNAFTKSDVFVSIIQDIVMGCKQISLKLFDGLSKEMSLEIYSLLLKYQSVLHIKEEILEQIRLVLFEKYKHTYIFKLNPSIDDLFENNVYKLVLHGKPYFVPLWHSELYYDYLGNADATTNPSELDDQATSEIIVKCVPDLGEDTFIDEFNNIHTTVKAKLSDISIQHPILSFQLGSRTFTIPCDKLMIKAQQYITIKKQGISRIDEINIYNVDSKSDIVVKVLLE